MIVNSYDERGRSLAEGSGFFISPDRVISNLRSIDSARLIRINTFSGKTIFVQSVVARYVDANIAILQLKKGVDAVALKVKIISLDKGAGIVLDNSEETEWRVTPALDGAWSFEHVATHLQVTAGLTETNGRGAVVKLKGHVNGTAVSVP